MPRTVTRRTIARGAAWSVPVVAVASQAPAATASTQCTFALNAVVTGTSQDRFGGVIYDMILTVEADPGCGPGAQLGQQINLAFDLPLDYSGWESDELTPDHGNPALPSYPRTNRTYQGNGDSGTVHLRLRPELGAPFTITFSAPGLRSGTQVQLA